MKSLTCQQYLANPLARQQIERQARRERGEAVYGFFIAPVLRLFKRPSAKPALSLQTRTA